MRDDPGGLLRSHSKQLRGLLFYCRSGYCIYLLRKRSDLDRASIEIGPGGKRVVVVNSRIRRTPNAAGAPHTGTRRPFARRRSPVILA